MAQHFNEAKMAQRSAIRRQLQEGRQRGAEWMIRMKNTLTGEIFPLYVGNGRTPISEFQRYVAKHGDNFDPIECYDFNKDLENQVIEDQTSNWDRQLPVQTGNFTNVQKFMGTGPKIDDNK